MKAGRRDRQSGGFTTLCGALCAIALLLGVPGFTRAQDASDQVEISISVKPSIDHPRANDDACPRVTPAVAHGMPGAVSAHIVLIRPESDDPEGQVIAYIVVRDDRGVATGWNITLGTTMLVDASAPELLANRQVAIMRVLPEDGRLSDQVQGISGGLALGPLTGSLPLLNAVAGSGSGLFLQQLVMLMPGLEATALDGVLAVQISFAP